MVIDLPRKTEKEYTAYKSKFYKKPNPPEIEVILENLQHEVVVNGRYDLMPEFKRNVSDYMKSFILKHLKNGKGVPEDSVNTLVDEAATNFLRRYFRFENPIVGGSFGGLFDKKVQEVISGYFKNENIKANISMDTNFFEDPESTYGNFLSYKKYLEEIHNEGDADLLLVPFKELSEICDNLEKIKKGISKKFLCYIYFMICLLERRNKKPLTALSPIALSMVDAEPDEESILETALLDLRGPIEKKKANEGETIGIIEKPKTKKKPKSLADDNEYWAAMEQCFGKYDYA